MDIAGQHGCHEAAIMIINHLTDRFDFVTEIFLGPQNKINKVESNEMSELTDDMFNGTKKCYEIRIVKHS